MMGKQLFQECVKDIKVFHFRVSTLNTAKEDTMSLLTVFLVIII